MNEEKTTKTLEIGESKSEVSKIKIDGKDVVPAEDIKGFVVSNAGKKPIPYDLAIGGADSAFPNYNFVLGGCYQCAGDGLSDWMRPIVMGNDPATVEQSFKYSIPLRDGHGRLYAYCGTQRYHAELEYEVCNVGAVKYLINQKTPDLPAESDDGTYVLKATKSGSTITYTWVKE